MDERGGRQRGICWFAENQKGGVPASEQRPGALQQFNAWVLDMRLNEKGYMLSREQLALSDIEGNILNLLGGYDGLEKLNPDDAEKKQVADPRDATQEYANARAAWVAEHKRDAKSAVLAEFRRP